MATLYIILTVGLAVSVTVAASIYSLRGNQQRQITTHSVTSAQAAAWRGVEVVRRYFLAVDQATLSQWTGATGLALPATISGMQTLGIPDGSARITAITGSGEQFEATVRITAYAGSGSTSTSATVEAVYDIGAGSAGGGQSPTCAVIPLTPMVFNGDLKISGGSMSVSNPASFEDVAVNGNLSLSNASQAMISGCAKGNITLSGGGIRSGGHLFAGGTISVDSMTPATDTTLWGRDVVISQYGGSYGAIQSGAFKADVYSAGALIGNVDIGGRLLASTTSGALPWTRGTVLPATNGKVTVQLSSGDQFLLDLSQLTTEASTGNVSGASSAERLQGESTASLPDQLQFKATAIAGGKLWMNSLTSQRLWGHAVTIAGYDGSYGVLHANGNAEIGNGRISALLGGADVTATKAGLYWNMPTIDSGVIAGKLRYGSNGDVVPDPSRVSAGLKVQQTGTTPGLPGIPFCDTRVNQLDVATYRDSANYIFEWIDNAPQLTIRNVRSASGTSLDGIYNLATRDLRSIPGTTGAFMTCNWQDASNGNGHCFRDKTATGAWSAKGLTSFPRGVAWFDNALNMDGMGLNNSDGVRGLVNTLVAKGNITLTTGGSNLYLTAPNHSTPERVCAGRFRPDNLCDMTGSSPQFAEWKDSDGVRRRGLPIANMALVTEGQGRFGGWNVLGNVVLGREMSNDGGRTTITGSLAVGTNLAGSSTTIGSGGADVIVPQRQEQQYVPGMCEVTPVTPAGPATASVRWSRYL